MLHYSLHLLARRQRAISIATLARMHQWLDTTLDAETTRVARVLSGGCSLVVALVIKTQSKFIHLVHMALSVIASDAEIIILQKKREGGISKVSQCFYKMHHNTAFLETLFKDIPNIIHPTWHFLPHKQYSESVSQRGACIHCTCRQSGPGSDCAVLLAYTWSSIWPASASWIQGACLVQLLGKHLVHPSDHRPSGGQGPKWVEGNWQKDQRWDG